VPKQGWSISLLSNECSDIVVFDVGGSHVSGGIFNVCHQRLEASKSHPIAANLSYEAFLELLASLVNELPRSTPVNGVAIAMPNPFDYKLGISHMRHKYQQLYGLDLRQGLSERLGCDPLRLHFLNDAAAFMLGELHRGAAIGTHRAVGITLGTGIGSAFAVDEEVVISGPGVPPDGEIWNVSYRNAIVETFVSTASIQREYAQATGGPLLEVWRIAELARQDSHAAEVLRHFGRELGQVLRHTCATFAPECIVLGGGISRSSWAFLDEAKHELAGLGIQLRISTLQHRASLIGAGIAWAREHGKVLLALPDANQPL
jgi:glucokinase